MAIVDDGRAYWTYWGKADPAVGGCHLAPFHMLDVAAVAVRVLERSAVLRSRFAGLLGVPEPCAGATMAAFIALHDIGKLDVRFALKAPAVAASLDPRLADLGGAGAYDHGAWGFVHARTEDAIWSVLGQRALVVPLLQAVTGHHGALPSAQPRSTGTAGDDVLRRFGTQDVLARAAFVKDVVGLFRSRGATLPLSADDDPTSAVVILLAGLCSVADWIGSQVEHFPYVGSPVDLGTYFDQRALPQADTALASAGLLGAKPSGRVFGELFPGRTPRDVQRITEGLCLPEGPALVIVEGQMGSGKTEAALSLSERFLARGDATRLYVGLPTQATANGMLNRIEDAAGRLFEGRIQLRLAHGQSRRHPAFQKLLERSLRGAWGDDDVAEVVCARWFLSRKRALLADVGVGTVDQAMQAAIRVTHHFVRTFALASSVVVIDEVHGYDAYMEVILERLIEWLGALGAPVVLLSATLPAERRRGLGESYRRGAGWPTAPEPCDPAPEPRDPGSVPYPLVTLVARAGTSLHDLREPLESHELAIEHVPVADPCAVVLPCLARAAGNRGMVAWIRNTVSDAQEAYDRAREAGLAPLLFHARMRPRDRARIEQQVLAQFGPDGERRGALLIATQVVEQSLDLDFDLLATDLAPVDLVLQRAGRLWRHERARPSGFDRRLLLVTPEPGEAAALRFGGSGRVYDGATLWLAQDSLATRGRVALPADIRWLVEATYDAKARKARIAAAANAAALLESEARRERELDGRKDAASHVCIPPVSFESRRLATFDDDDEKVRALTRDGESERVLLVDWSADGCARSIDGVEWDAGALDPQRADAWRLASELGDEIISFPAWEWDLIERGARPRGEHAEWERFAQRMLRFLECSGLGRVVPVPGRTKGDEFVGHLERARGTRLRVRYGRERGLALEKEG